MMPVNGSSFGTTNRFAAPVTRRYREGQHLIDTAPVDPENPSRLAPAHALNNNRVPHLRPYSSTCFIPALCQKAERITLVEFYSGQQPDNLAASVVVVAQHHPKNRHMLGMSVMCH